MLSRFGQRGKPITESQTETGGLVSHPIFAIYYETLNPSHLPFEQFFYVLNEEVKLDIFKSPSQH